MPKFIHIMVDVESTGPVAPDYSMVEIGAVAMTPALDKDFHVNIRPLEWSSFDEGALSVLKTTPDELRRKGVEPATAMIWFESWLNQWGPGYQPRFVSDNPGFDFAFVNWYFHNFRGHNPFGWSSMNLGSFYKGIMRDNFCSFKHLRKTAHTHNALDDARGNAEALLAICETYRIKGIITRP